MVAVKSGRYSGISTSIELSCEAISVYVAGIPSRGDVPTPPGTLPAPGGGEDCGRVHCRAGIGLPICGWPVTAPMIGCVTSLFGESDSAQFEQREGRDLGHAGDGDPGVRPARQAERHPPPLRHSQPRSVVVARPPTRNPESLEAKDQREACTMHHDSHVPESVDNLGYSVGRPSHVPARCPPDPFAFRVITTLPRPKSSPPWLSSRVSTASARAAGSGPTVQRNGGTI